VLVAFIYGPGGAETRVYSSVPDFDRQLHETLGLTIVVLVTLRPFWRMLDRQPEPPEIPAGWAWQRRSYNACSTFCCSRCRLPP